MITGRKVPRDMVDKLKLFALVNATLEPPTARVLVQLPTGEHAVVRGVTSRNGEIIIQASLDARHEGRG